MCKRKLGLPKENLLIAGKKCASRSVRSRRNKNAFVHIHAVQHPHFNFVFIVFL